MKDNNNAAKGIAKKDCCMMGIYHCLAVAFATDVEINEKDFVQITWKQFQRRNRKKEKRYKDHYEGWFFDEWLLKKIKAIVYAFGYYLNDVEVFMPKRDLPLIVKVISVHPEDRNFCILIAPRVANIEEIQNQ